MGLATDLLLSEILDGPLAQWVRTWWPPRCILWHIAAFCNSHKTLYIVFTTMKTNRDGLNYMLKDVYRLLLFRSWWGHPFVILHSLIIGGGWGKNIHCNCIVLVQGHFYIVLSLLCVSGQKEDWAKVCECWWALASPSSLLTFAGGKNQFPQQHSLSVPGRVWECSLWYYKCRVRN